MSEVVIENKHNKKYYGTSRGVEDVSLKINQGDIYGFIGPNGAGKSTTIRTIMGLINKTSGEIFIKGKKSYENCRSAQPFQILPGNQQRRGRAAPGSMGAVQGHRPGGHRGLYAPQMAGRIKGNAR